MAKAAGIVHSYEVKTLEEFEGQAREARDREAPQEQAKVKKPSAEGVAQREKDRLILGIFRLGGT